MPFFDLNQAQLLELLKDQPTYRVKQVWQGVYEGLERPHEITSLPKSLRERMGQEMDFALSLNPVDRVAADDRRTIKVLWGLADGRQVESVLMAYSDRVTLCVSSQAGCAMGCVFCATGQAGFFRHLTKGEILEQVFHASVLSKRGFGQRLSNLVFMGMGEPMANYENVVAAIRSIVNDFGVSARHITLSTVGIIPGIRRLAEEELPISLAVSIHAANDEKRTRLVPMNARYPLDDLVEALTYYRSRSNRRISFEWAMMAGINDGLQDAIELAALAKRVGAHVNLIPLNPTPGWDYPGSAPEVVREFRDQLTDSGINATIRANRGNQIAAACGQLQTQFSRRARISDRTDTQDLFRLV
ncbi:MAG: 23S rRNA (adenine(2503)-C(2))-methyltransferase RlmN [Actinomycetota bacterium]|nr:23S rRNA (adenine(2503)-C(2))-methyltransferase RlmN [Actinomycetota bacterium]